MPPAGIWPLVSNRMGTIPLKVANWVLHEHQGSLGSVDVWDIQDLESLIWLRSHGCQWGKKAAVHLAKIGNLELLQWAHKEGLQFDSFKIYGPPASSGNLPILRWLHEIGCPFDEMIFKRSFLSSQTFEGLNWLKDNRCPTTDSLVPIAAARVGLLQFKWAHENGFDLFLGVWMSVMSLGKIDILSYGWERRLFGVDNVLICHLMDLKDTTSLGFFKEIKFNFSPENWDFA